MSWQFIENELNTIVSQLLFTFKHCLFAEIVVL